MNFNIPQENFSAYLVWFLLSPNTADQLFQYIANETNTKKSGSTYGLKPSSSQQNRTVSPTSAASSTTTETTPSTSETTLTPSEQPEAKKEQ